MFCNALKPKQHAEPDLVAVLGLGGTAYLYRVAESTRPAGVGVYTESEPKHGSIVQVNIIFPWGATVSTQALVHWSTHVNATLSIIGLKLYNPDVTVTQAMQRAASLLPVFSYDDATYA